MKVRVYPVCVSVMMNADAEKNVNSSDERKKAYRAGILPHDPAQ